MSKTKKEKELTLDNVKLAVKRAAKDSMIHESKVTIAMMNNQDKRITEWSLRRFGGLSGIRKYFPISNKDLAILREQKDLQSYVNKLEKDLGEKLNFEKKVLNTIEKAVSGLKPKKYRVPKKTTGKGKEMAMELMLSDIHFGKETKTFNLKILKQRLDKLTSVFLSEMNKKEKDGYNVNQIIISLIGDIIESYTMHGTESALSCEFGNSRQIQESIDNIFDHVLLPIAMTGKKIHIPAVAGNHDRTERNRTFNNPGETYVTWIIYKSLERYCQLSGLKNITFDIPVDSYTTYDLFGKHTIMYEHLDNISSPTKSVLEGLIKKRSEQIGKMIHMVRGGHWHERLSVDRGRIIINESACGQDSFAKVKGYSSKAGQTIVFYVNDDNLPNGYLYDYPVHLE